MHSFSSSQEENIPRDLCRALWFPVLQIPETKDAERLSPFRYSDRTRCTQALSLESQRKWFGAAQRLDFLPPPQSQETIQSILQRVPKQTRAESRTPDRYTSQALRNADYNSVALLFLMEWNALITFLHEVLPDSASAPLESDFPSDGRYPWANTLELSSLYSLPEQPVIATLPRHLRLQMIFPLLGLFAPPNLIELKEVFWPHETLPFVYDSRLPEPELFDAGLYRRQVACWSVLRSFSLHCLQLVEWSLQGNVLARWSELLQEDFREWDQQVEQFESGLKATWSVVQGHFPTLTPPPFPPLSPTLTLSAIPDPGLSETETQIVRGLMGETEVRRLKEELQEKEALAYRNLEVATRGWLREQVWEQWRQHTSIVHAASRRLTQTLTQLRSRLMSIDKHPLWWVRLPYLTSLRTWTRLWHEWKNAEAALFPFTQLRELETRLVEAFGEYLEARKRVCQIALAQEIAELGEVVTVAPSQNATWWGQVCLKLDDSLVTVTHRLHELGETAGLDFLKERSTDPPGRLLKQITELGEAVVKSLLQRSEAYLDVTQRPLACRDWTLPFFFRLQVTTAQQEALVALLSQLQMCPPVTWTSDPFLPDLHDCPTLTAVYERIKTRTRTQNSMLQWMIYLSRLLARFCIHRV